MKVQLLVSDWCASCHAAEKIWREVAEERDFDFAVVDMGQPEGRELVSRLRLKTIPALVVDDTLMGVGVQSKEEARRIVAAAPPKASSEVQHVGLSLAPAARVAVLSAMAYLLLSGALLAIHGSLLPVGPGRPAALHLFTLGFLVFLIYGLGEHMLPRFTGNPIWTGWIAWLQLAAAHAGVIAMATGFWLGREALTLAGMVCAWLALAVFTLRLWPVLWVEPRSGAGEIRTTGP